MANARTTHPQVRIVVVGGGFAGRSALQHLLTVRNQQNLHLTLIDEKPFFEYTPSILRCIVEPNHFRNIVASQQLKNVNFVHGHATTVTSTHIGVQLEQMHRSGSTNVNIPYQFLVWAVGVAFTFPIRSYLSGSASHTITRRTIELTACNQDIINARRVLVIGAGPVGVELAAELAHFVTAAGASTEITLAASPRGVLPRLPPSAGQYARKKLIQSGVKIIFARLQKHSNTTPFTYVGEDIGSAGERISVVADIVFTCTGARCRGEGSALVDGRLCRATDVRRDGAVRVTPSLQLPGHPHIFIAGDAAHTPAEEEQSGKPNCEKMAYAADGSGKLAALNICTLISSSDHSVSLLRYPEDAYPFKQFPRVFVISLYKYDAIMCADALVITGVLPAATKWLLESMGVASARGNRLAFFGMFVMAHASFLLAKLVSFVFPRPRYPA